VSTESRIQLERRLLAALCTGTQGPARESLRARLSNYAWTDAVHQALFEILTSIPSWNADALRELLPAGLTRRGFPDFDFTGLFSAPIASREEVESWAAQLGGLNS